MSCRRRLSDIPWTPSPDGEERTRADTAVRRWNSITRKPESVSTPATKDAGTGDYTLFDVEERVLRDAEEMVRKLDEVAQGVRTLAEAYRRSYREQSRLVRLSDRMQEELQEANHGLTQQAEELRELNSVLRTEIEERERLAMELQRLATVDELTGLFGRRHFMHLAERELTRRHRTHGPVTAIMVDLDRFKRVNDTHGHAVGDSVLRKVGDVLRSELRALDLAGRLGGEEFAVLLPDTPLDAGQDIAERLREATAACGLSLPNGDTLRFTASFGVAEHDAHESLDSLLHRADTALYEAKRAGRNRVMTTPVLDGEASSVTEPSPSDTLSAPRMSAIPSETTKTP